MKSVGMRALAVKYPSVSRTNEFWLKNYPELIANIENKGDQKIWNAPDEDTGPSALFDSIMRPYLNDPFRGTKGRRILGPGESALSMEVDAIKMALEAAQLDKSEIDMLISVSFLPMTPGCGDGVYITHELDLDCPGINMESACSGSVVAFQHACALVRSGQCKNVMVSVSCNYSVHMPPSLTMSLISGDGAAAFIVSEVEEGCGYLGGKTINTRETVPALHFLLVINEDGEPQVSSEMNPVGGKIIRETNQKYLMECTKKACESAQVDLHDIDFFIFNTPIAWYSKFCTTALEIDPQKTIDTFELYANTGPALMTGNLYHALLEKRINKDNLVLLYSIGSVATASSAIMRWSPIPIGPPPEPTTSTQ